MELLTYQPQPENWLYEIKQKGNSETCYVMVKVRIALPSQMMAFLFIIIKSRLIWHQSGLRNLFLK